MTRSPGEKRALRHPQDRGVKSLKSAARNAGLCTDCSAVDVDRKEQRTVAKERRRKARHEVLGWTGRYRLQHASAWRECTVVDISETGAGFQAFMLPTDALPMMTAELELVDGSGNAEETIRLRGTISHLTRSQEGHVRVGIEFLGLTELEARLLGMLFGRDGSGRARQAIGSSRP